jgi:hypothetical protein
MHGALLEKQIEGFRRWNLDDLRLVKRSKKMTGIPNFLSHLKTYSGHPAPFTQVWIDGKPDFSCC